MKNNMRFHLLCFILLFVSELNAQMQNNIVNFDKNAKVLETSSSPSFLSAKVGKMDLKGIVRTTYAILFDRNGKRLMEKKSDAGGFILQAEPVEPFNIFLVIDEGIGEPYDGKPALDDAIRAYDIVTGNELWHASANSKRYIVSPNAKYLLTRANTIETGASGSEFTIFNLRDGSKIPHNLKLGGWSADWLDSERIIIAIQQLKSDSATQKRLAELNKKTRERELLIDSLVQLRLRSSLELRNKRISKEKYDNQVTDLTAKINDLRKLQSTEIMKDSLSPRKHATKPAASKLMIYNMLTGRIEIEKDIYDQDGEPIFIAGTGEPSVGALNVERSSQTIFFFARKGLKGGTRCLARLDKSLNVLMATPINLRRFTKLNAEDEIFFVGLRNGKRVLVDKNTGITVETSKIITKLGNIDLDAVEFDRFIPRKTFIRNIYVPGNNNSIEFRFTKEEKQ